MGETKGLALVRRDVDLHLDPVVLGVDFAGSEWKWMKLGFS